VDNAIGGFPLFYFALALVLGALSAGSEYTWRTVRLVLAAGAGRLRMVAAKLAVLGIAVAAIAVTAFAAAGAASVVVAVIEGGSLEPPPAGEIALGIGAAWLILAAGATLGVAGGILARSSGAVIGAGLVYLFVVEVLLRSFAPASEPIERVAALLPGSNAGSLAGALTDVVGAPGVNTLVGGTQALVALGAWIAIGAVIGIAVFARRDVTA
jgi:ABC-type transport system involved in multi-copper enzyme maturation permease subunit